MEISEMSLQLGRERKDKNDAITQQKYLEEELKKEKKHYFMQYETLGTSFKKDTQHLKQQTGGLQQQVEQLQQQLAVFREENAENEVLIEQLKAKINLNEISDLDNDISLSDKVATGVEVEEDAVSPPPPVSTVIPCSPSQRDLLFRGLFDIIPLAEAESQSLSLNVKKISSAATPFSADVASIISSLLVICRRLAAAQIPSPINYTPRTTATQSPPPSISNPLPSTRGPVRPTSRSPPALFDLVMRGATVQEDSSTEPVTFVPLFR
eukprot:TRINITY_DN26419_c0_g1_i1.p1 TRINITY_DN26419_c0_g1~~TRINITY_DN26419_c0_g1_i1.p1  ORF type:complete len:314 (+),score=66.97 TRINITY_DN26419_c0_g1_i1:144-944(+)